MEIASLKFAVLALLSVFGFYLIKPKYRIVFLALLSCGFIATYSYNLLIYVLFYALINFSLGKKIPGSNCKKFLFRAGIVFNLAQLIILKYSSFAIDPFFQILGSNIKVAKIAEVIIPVGISFFTLQGIGYLVNIKMGWEQPEKKFLHFLLYIIFYPKFLSGPIERSKHFLQQLKTIHSFNEKQVTDGLRIALIGLFKKIVIANELGVIVSSTYSDLNSYGGLSLWIVVLIQPLYLYFDFSGYTDIAIGFAKTFGIELLPNFNKPFLSENVTTLWRRMHMSLSLWFNDYVFKQISFRYRKWGKYAPVFAVFVTFTLFGIWHGAGWNYMALGFTQALAINYEFFTKRSRVAIFSKLPDFFRIWIGRLSTYLFFGITHIFFFSSDIKTSFNFFARLTSSDIRLPKEFIPETVILAIIFSIVFLIMEVISSDFSTFNSKLEEYWRNHRFFRISFYYVMAVAILIFIGDQATFIYQAF